MTHHQPCIAPTVDNRAILGSSHLSIIGGNSNQGDPVTCTSNNIVIVVLLVIVMVLGAILAYVYVKIISPMKNKDKLTPSELSSPQSSNFVTVTETSFSDYV